MDFSLVLSIILAVLMCFFVPITCYVFCKRPVLDKFRNIFLVFYLIVLFVGVTSHLTISEGVVHLEYQFTKIWGNKDMSWGFENLTVLNALLNLFMLVPLGAYIASSKKEQKPVYTILTSCVVGLLISLLIETLQYMLPVDRVVEFSDTVLNTISAGLGALMIVLFKKPRQHFQQKIKNED